MPFILAETLGRTDDSANKAALWGLLLAMPGAARRNAARAGFPSPSAWSILARPGRMARAVGAAVRYGSVAPLMALHPNILQSELIYNQLLEHPEGIWIGKLDPGSEHEGTPHAGQKDPSPHPRAGRAVEGD